MKAVHRRSNFSYEWITLVKKSRMRIPKTDKTNNQI